MNPLAEGTSGTTCILAVLVQAPCRLPRRTCAPSFCPCGSRSWRRRRGSCCRPLPAPLLPRRDYLPTFLARWWPARAFRDGRTPPSTAPELPRHLFRVLGPRTDRPYTDGSSSTRKRKNQIRSHLSSGCVNAAANVAAQLGVPFEDVDQMRSPSSADRR